METQEDAGPDFKTIVYELDGCGNYINKPVTQTIWDDSKGGYAELLLPFTVEVENKNENVFVGWMFVRQKGIRNAKGNWVPANLYKRCRIRFVNEYRPWTVRMVKKK